MKLLYGKPIADDILNHLKDEIALHSAKPGLAVILVGNDSASQIYVGLKEKKAQEIGMNFFRYDLPENISQVEIIERVEKLNKDTLVNGIIVQLPLPNGFDTKKIIASIDPKKDADGFHPVNTEKFLKGENGVWPVFPHAIIHLLENSKQQLCDKKAMVIANSDEFGKIMCSALQRRGVLSEYVLSKNIFQNIDKIQDADIIVSAVGSPGLLSGKMLKDGIIVIDGGIKKINNTVFGDVDIVSTNILSGYIAPVPGGVGPLTIACLLNNTFLAFEAKQKEKQ